MDNSAKSISSQLPYIIDLFKHILEKEITEEHAKEYKGGLAIFFTFRCRELYLCFDSWSEKYLLYHMNSAQNPRRGNKWHLQRWEYSLGAMFSYLSTMHSPVDLNKKKSRVDSLFDLIEEDRKRVESNRKEREEFLEKIKQL